MPPQQGVDHAVIHYFRADGDYGDHTTGNYNDYWGLHLWGDITETIDWTAPKPFLGEDEYGRFAWVSLSPSADQRRFHRPPRRHQGWHARRPLLQPVADAGDLAQGG